MKLTVGHVYQATELVTAIINQGRPMPQKGQYRIARLYAKLKPEYDLIVGRRNAMIEAYGHHEMVDPPMTAEDPLGQGEKVPAPNFSVPADRMPEFTKAWAEVAAEEIEVAVDSIPLAQLDSGGPAGTITAGELIVLDDLVSMTD